MKQSCFNNTETIMGMPWMLGMGHTSYFIFDPIPIFSSPISSISIPIPVN